MTFRNRIITHPILGTMDTRKEITFTFNQQAFSALEGETIAAALLANGVRTLRRHEETGSPRGIYCNIGHCYECRVSVDGQNGIRSCLTVITDGITIDSGHVLPTPLKKKVIQND